MVTKKQPFGSRAGKHDPPRPKDWSDYFKSETSASPEFMNGIEDLPVQERAIFQYSKTARANAPTRKRSS